MQLGPLDTLDRNVGAKERLITDMLDVSPIKAHVLGVTDRLAKPID